MELRRTRDLVIEDDKGGMLQVEPDDRTVELRAHDGTTRFLAARACGDLLEGEFVALHRVRSCMLGVGDSGTATCVVRISFADATAEVIARIERTELIEEGFDYVTFVDTDGGSVLCFEQGLLRFDDAGLVEWQKMFGELHVAPRFENGVAAYDEINGTVRYSLTNGERLGVLPPLDPEV